MIKVVVFDLDDTLISEKQYIKSGYHHIAKLLHSELGIDEGKLYSDLTELFNKSSKNVFNRLFDKLEVVYTQDTIMKLVEEYRNHLPDIEFFKDAIPCFESLKQKGIKLGIITDGYLNAQRQKLKAVEAYDYFDEIIMTDELGREYWKPHTKAFEMVREKFNVEFNEMIYVGDNPEKDFYISKIYPITTVRIYRNGVYKEKKYFKDIMEDKRINSLAEMNKLIDSLL
jgi:putative hydrolase of the HAD superfamily